MNSSARTVTRSRPSSNSNSSDSSQTRKTITERAFAKALQIETYDSARNRTMWYRLKSDTATATAL